MEFCKHNWATISETICPQNAYFWQVGLVDIVLSEYLDKSHNFRNFIFMTSHFSTLLQIFKAFFSRKRNTPKKRKINEVNKERSFLNVITSTPF